MTNNTQTPLEWFMELVGPSSEGLYQVPFQTTTLNIRDFVLISEEAYKAIYDKFTSCTTLPQLVTGSKIYIHGRTSLTNDRWNNLFKKNGWSRTYKISEADLILINNQDCSKPDSQKSFITSVTQLLDCNARHMSFITEDYKKEFNKKYLSQPITVGYDRVIVSRYGVYQPNLDNNNGGLYDSYVGNIYMVFTEAIEMFYIHMNKNIPIINEKLLASKSGNGVIVDEEKFESLRDMLKSSDEENHLVARKILYECDIDNSLYYIWKLCKAHCFWQMHENRTKLGREFVAKTKLYQLHNMSAKRFLAEIESRKLLTKEIFMNLRQELLDEVRSTLIKQNVHNLVDISFQFNKTYSEYLDSNEPVVITLDKKDDNNDDE